MPLVSSWIVNWFIKEKQVQRTISSVNTLNLHFTVVINSDNIGRQDVGLAALFLLILF